MVQVRYAGIVAGHGLAAKFRVTATVNTVENHAVALRRGLVVPVAAGGIAQVHIAVQIKVGRRRVKGRMRAHKAGHEEERASTVARLQKADGLVHNPVGGVQALLVDPRMGDPGVVLHAGAVDVGELAQLVLEEAHVVVAYRLVHPMGQVRLAVVANIAVMQTHVLKSAAQAGRVDVHLANHRGLVAAVAHLLRQHVVIFPVNAVLVANAPVVPGRFTGEQAGARGDAAGARGIGVLKQHAVRRERVQVGRLHIRMPVYAQAVTSKLVAHNQQDVGALRGRRGTAFLHYALLPMVFIKHIK